MYTEINVKYYQNGQYQHNTVFRETEVSQWPVGNPHSHGK